VSERTPANEGPAQTLPDSPFPGLSPFAERDARFFFGRQAETRIVAANLVVSRMTVLYGPSGVGKSSLLRAGVAPSLGDRVVVVFPPDPDGALETTHFLGATTRPPGCSRPPIHRCSG
jgi:hypothetical protein